MFQLQECVVCGEHKKKGMWLNHRFLCVECEQEIAHTDITESKYIYFIDRLRSLSLFTSQNVI